MTESAVFLSLTENIPSSKSTAQHQILSILTYKVPKNSKEPTVYPVLLFFVAMNAKTNVI